MVEGRDQLSPQQGGRDRGPAGKLIRWDAQHGADFAADLQHAEAGAPEFVEHLASRPIIMPEAEEYLSAFLRLARDRPKTVLGGGMGPSIQLPERVPLAVIRAEGERLGFEGEDLEFFIWILDVTDDLFIELRTKQIHEDVRRALAESRRNR